MKKLELFLPVTPWSVNFGFGANKEYYKKEFGLDGGHNGIDIKTYRGQIVRAAHDGIVTFAGEDGAAGTGVVIRTHDERDYFGTPSFFKSIYWHLIKQVNVKAGQKVRVGDVIGWADSTGKSTGDHLHFGIKPVAKGEADWAWFNTEQNNGTNGAIDPAPYLSKISAEQMRGFMAKYDELQTWYLKLKGNMI